jgi:HEPN domain-containing protein
MPDSESQYPKDWFRIAAKDLQRVTKRLAEGDVDDAAFRLQLLSQGWRLRRIHDIEALLNEAIPYDKRLERCRSLCQQVAGYYLIERYPMFEEGPSRADVEEAYRQTKALVRLLASRRLAGRVRGRSS